MLKKLSIIYIIVFTCLFIHLWAKKHNNKDTIKTEDPHVLWVDNFENNTLDTLPQNWKGKTKNSKKYYKIAKENDNLYLKVINHKKFEFIGKTSKINIKKYPYLNWKWRAHRFPKNANENVRSLCDVVASINIIVKAKKFLGVYTPHTIKYSWSTTLPRFTITKSPYAKWPSKCDIVVLRSGHHLKGKWIEEKRNVYKDYLKFYKKRAGVKKIIDLVVLQSDGDSTQSIVEADYDDIYFSKK